MNKKIAFAGSSHYSRKILETLYQSDWEIEYVLAPAPRLVGRKKILTESPVVLFCQENKIKYFHIDKKLSEVRAEIEKIDLDLFLVMDFGYFLPDWLIYLPKHQTLNIHPSLLPDWRGSSPGQFSLLFGQKESAVTLMKINEKMDQGEIIKQIKFKVEDEFKQDDYYNLAFDLIKEKLILFLNDYIEDKINLIKQPDNFSSPLARMLKKQDSYFDFKIFKNIVFKNFGKYDDERYHQCMENLISEKSNVNIKTPILEFLLNNSPDSIKGKIIWQAFKAFYQWPGIWTKVPTNKGLKIMKITKMEWNNNRVVIKKVKIEGKNEANFNEVKNQIIWQ